MLKPFTDLEDILNSPHHKFSERKMKILNRVINEIGVEKISGAKSRSRDRMTIYTFCDTADLPELEGIRWAQDHYFQDDEFNDEEFF